jgi:seryl-tRNA synthetase
MLDMAFIRSNPDVVREAMRRRHQRAPVDELLALDEKRREVNTAVDEKRAARNIASKQIAEKKKAGQDAAGSIAETRKLGDEITGLEAQLREFEQQMRDLILRIPNVPAKDVPEGRGPEDNTVVREGGNAKSFPFKPKAHWDLAKALDLIDFERASKIAGSHFALFKGAGATLVRALMNFMLDAQTKRGYTEVFVPFLANRDSMTGTGQLPKFEEDMYRCELDDLFLIPTSEVPVTNIHRDDVLDAGKLPVRYTAFSPCFRREAGSYGRDTRGLMRVHQFEKVELVKFVEPETSYNELELLLADAEEVVRKLGLRYRIVTLCGGELGFSAAKTYDIEVWAPGLERWMEVSSCSNFEDFQARRANIRYRTKEGKLRFVHTLNGSGVAFARTILCLLETHQQENGTVVIPECLRVYFGGRELID